MLVCGYEASALSASFVSDESVRAGSAAVQSHYQTVTQYAGREQEEPESIVNWLESSPHITTLSKETTLITDMLYQLNNIPGAIASRRSTTVNQSTNAL